ncbi:hypothetical protein ZOSMA_206G00120 [Zostera marina]|uniref:Uncharacterized protein n=1 Tax=Zostera marina TaxID=29655 RepID=A0A0K9PL64_ZOSMR|nr:hypothetical protein ZOSMA_206G00120 [Zostera marina]
MSTSVPTATGHSGFRQILTPLGSTKKRKDKNTLETPHVIFSPRRPPHKKTKPKLPPPKPKPNNNTATATATTTTTGKGKGNNNMLFAGYLAHEYLKRGTLMGQRWNPSPTTEEEKVEKDDDDGMKIYNDVSSLVMSGVHITDVVNPTELNRWCVQKRR